MTNNAPFFPSEPDRRWCDVKVAKRTQASPPDESADESTDGSATKTRNEPKAADAGSLAPSPSS